MAHNADPILAINNVMGAEEAATTWGISKAHIKTLCANGVVIARKSGRNWIIEKNQPNPRRRAYYPKETENIEEAAE